jgi:hypothetical protein
VKSRGKRKVVRVSQSDKSRFARRVVRTLGQFSVFAFFAILICALPTRAQTSASIKGVVTDASGASVAGASVYARNVETGAARSAVTDDAGRFLVLSLMIGEYQVKVSKQGFRDALRSGIHLAVGQEATVNIKLDVSGVKAEATVTADAPIVSTTTRNINGLVGEREIKDLPLNGRSYDLLMTLNPSIVNFTSQKTGGTGISNSSTATVRNKTCFC